MLKTHSTETANPQEVQTTVNAPQKLHDLTDKARTWVHSGHAHSVVLMGSHARQQTLPSSKIDIACIIQSESKRRAMESTLAKELDPKSGILCGIIATCDQLRRNAHTADALGALVNDGIVLAGERSILDQTTVALAPPQDLANYYATGIEQLGLTWRYLHGSRQPPPILLATFDAATWLFHHALIRLTRKRPETLHAWHARRCTRLASIGAEHIARLVAASAGLNQTGIRFLEDQMNQVHRTIQTDESWRLEALGRATRPKPGPEPRNIAIGAHDTPEALVERVTGAIHGVAWWLTHGNYTATGPSHTNRVAETLATPWGKRTTQRWVLGEQGQAARSHAPLAIDNALNAVESRTVQHAPTRT